MIDMLSASSLVTAYSILAGVMMIGLWGFLLFKDQVPELHEAINKEITLHLVNEFLTAVLLTISGVGLFLGGEWARTLLPAALGMLLYTITVSAGKYADEDNLTTVAMFGVLTILTITAIAGIFMFIQG